MHFICDFTQKAVVEVYRTMFSLDPKPIHVVEGQEHTCGKFSGVLGSVSFAGKINGVVYMNYSEKLACGLAERLLGCKPDAATALEVGDMIGEIANMVSGDMKRRAAEIGYNGLLAPPIVMRGAGIVVEPRESPIAAYSVFRIPELDEDLGVQVYAKLAA